MARGQDPAAGVWETPNVLGWAGWEERFRNASRRPLEDVSRKVGKEGISNKGAAQQSLEVGLRTPSLLRSQAGRQSPSLTPVWIGRAATPKSSAPWWPNVSVNSQVGHIY